MMAPVQRPCLVPGCTETALGSPLDFHGDQLGSCLTHRHAKTIEVDGVPLRCCAACCSLEPAAGFSSSRTCRACRGRYDARRRRYCMSRHLLMNSRGGLFQVLQRWFPLFRSTLQALSIHISPATADRDHGKEVCGTAIVAFLRGEPTSAKVTLPIMYSAACSLLGPHKAETWASLALSASFLHLLLPYSHQRWYAQPLREVRQVAARPGLALSSSFQFLHPDGQLNYEGFVRKSAGPVYAGSVGRMAGVFLAVVVSCMQCFDAMNKVWGLSRGPPLLGFLALVGAAYFPVRLHAMASHRHWRSQLLDTSMLIIGTALSVLPSLLAWVLGAHSCGFPKAFHSICSELELNLLVILFVAASWATLSALLDVPVSMVATFIAATTVLRAGMVVISPWCFMAETGMALSSLTQVLAFESWVAGGIVCLALQIRHEKARLLRYAHQLQAKPAAPGLGFHQSAPHLLVAMKMGGVTPADLPIDLRERILSVMKVTPVSLTGVIRPGCVLLGLEMCFHSSADMQSAWTALLSHSNWGETLLDSSSSSIDMSIQGSLYTVRGGRLRHRLPAIQGNPAIATVEPLAPFAPCETLTLTLSKIGESTFRVLLRCGVDYHELEVVERSTEDPSTGMSTAVVRLPEATLCGVGWVEVMLDSKDGALVMTEASAVLFTSVPGVAEELSRVLPAHFPGDSQFILAGLLRDLVTYLEDQSALPPLLLLHVTKLGLCNCFKHLATSATALSDADRHGQGLLGSAVMSGSIEMLDLVMSRMEDFRLPVDPCQRAPDARGYSALHWAAEAGDACLVYKLLAMVPWPLESWKHFKARTCGKTPAELMADAGSACDIDEEVLTSAEPGYVDCWSLGCQEEDAAAAVWGAHVAAALGRHPMVTHISLVALYAAMCVQLGWQDPLAWWTVAMTFVTLHILLPYVYKEVYLKGLAKVRDLAAEQGLSVSWALRLLGAADMQGMYEQFATERATAKLVSSSVWTSGVLLVMLASLSQLFEEWGMWRHIPVVLCCGALVSLQVFAILTKRLLIWRWVEPLLTLFCCAKAGLPELAWLTDNPPLCMMSSSVQSHAQNMLLLGIQPAVIAAILTFLLASVPKAPGAPVHLPSEIPMLFRLAVTVPEALQWCAETLTGQDNIGNMKNILRIVVPCTWRLLMLGVRLRDETQNLCAFLTTNAISRPAKDSVHCE